MMRCLAAVVLAAGCVVTDPQALDVNEPGMQTAETQPQRKVVTSTSISVIQDVRWTDDDAIAPDSREMLEQIARTMDDFGLSLEIRAYMDPATPDALARAQRRADAAMHYLIALGVPPERLSAVGQIDEAQATNVSFVITARADSQP